MAVMAIIAMNVKLAAVTVLAERSAKYLTVDLAGAT
jgi:hypothetical protein